MLKVLKEIFWDGAFRRDAKLLDRDRFLLGLMALVYVQTCLLLNNSLLTPTPDTMFFEGKTAFILNLYWSFLRMEFSIDPIFLVLHVLLAARAFGRWLGVPLGVISFLATVGGTRSIIVAIKEFYRYELPDEAAVGLLVIAVIWLLPVIYMLFRSGLRTSQPDHPLFTQNPDYPAEHQLSPIAFLHRVIILGLVSFLIMFTINILFAIFGSYSGQTAIMVVNLFVSLGAMILSIWFAVKRLRNLGWNPLPWMLFLMIIPMAISLLVNWLYLETYFYNAWIYIAVTIFTPVFKWFFMIIAMMIMLKPHNLPEKQLTLDL